MALKQLPGLTWVPLLLGVVPQATTHNHDLWGLPTRKQPQAMRRTAWPHHRCPGQHAQKGKFLTDSFGKHMCYW